jgi:hypothetical protein
MMHPQAIKLQYNEGLGGCFPMHLDSDAALDGRTVTAIFYLNPRYCSDACIEVNVRFLTITF